MRTFKALGIALIAVLSLAATAAARPPQFLPSPNTFTIKGGSSILGTLGANNLLCTSVTGTGKLETDSHGTLSIVFTGCLSVSVGTKCTGLSDTTTGTITASGTFLTRWLTSNGGTAVIVVSFSGVHFSCSIVLVKVSGSVAGVVTPGVGIKVKTTEHYTVKFERTGNDAKIAEVLNEAETGKETVLLNLNFNDGSAESSGEEASAELTPEKESELMV